MKTEQLTIQRASVDAPTGPPPCFGLPIDDDRTGRSSLIRLFRPAAGGPHFRVVICERDECFSTDRTAASGHVSGWRAPHHTTREDSMFPSDSSQDSSPSSDASDVPTAPHGNESTSLGGRSFVRLKGADSVLSGIILACLVVIPRSGAAQDIRASSDGLWRGVAEAKSVEVALLQTATIAERGGFAPKAFRLFDLNPAVLKQLIEGAPSDVAATAILDQPKGERVTVPMPDGTFQRFELIESPVMSAALAAKFPEIRSFRGRGIDDPILSMRMDVSHRGLHVQVLAPEGTVIVDPILEADRYMTYNKRVNRSSSQPFECLVGGREAAAARQAGAGINLRSGENLRTYRLAMACTGEYAQHFGGSVADAMAAINTTVNRVSGIYEREAAIRFQLVDNNDQLVFVDAQTDPFDNASASRLIGQSQSVIDGRIGDANYDLGHTLSTGAGGLAGLGVVGVSGQKARGVTGRPNPSGDPFDVDYVAHEIGHQFGGDHTFNGRAGNCSGGNRNAATAVEPGSGSTIQAYAGICSADDLQSNSDPYFHSISLDQIVAYATIGPGNVATTQPTGNGVPTVSAGADIHIPCQTPFRLTAVGTDPDGDPLLYCWEQRDLGPSAMLDEPDDGRIPLFRSLSPARTATRVFPKWSDILHRTATPGEQLPVHSRMMNLHVSVRDGRSGGGAVSSDNVQVHVEASAGPFQVTAPAVSSVTSNLVDVQWDVAGTDRTPISCQLVNIRLSCDGGQSFSDVLASNTPNDGRQLVALPAAVSTHLRILVDSVDNAFFAVSPVNFNVPAAGKEVYVTRHAEKESGVDPGLTSTGALRALNLADLMARLGATHVYSTSFRRTRETAQPTATAVGVSIQEYSEETALAHEIASLGPRARVLVVGHSNTVGTILASLGVDEPIVIAEHDFSNLYYARFTNNGVSFRRYTYDPILLPAEPTAQGQRRPAVSQSRLNSTSILPQRPAARETSTSARTPSDRFAKSDLPVVYWTQNWTPAESLEFYRLRQGSPIMRKAFFDALEQPGASALFRDSGFLATFGFLPQRAHQGNPDGYPIGFSGSDAIEIACAACHTSRIVHEGVEYRIDGSQAMVDIESWLAELVRAIRATMADAPDLIGRSPSQRIPLDLGTKFGRFANRVLNTSQPRVAQVRIVLQLLASDLSRRQRYNDYNDFGKRFSTDSDRDSTAKHEPYGYGRLDALGAILNQACAESLGIDENAAPANAPVNFPAIWDAPQHTHVQWNGAVDNTARFGPLGRNAGQVIGVFGVVQVEGAVLGYDSSISFDAIKRAEQLVTKLWSPAWPDAFGKDPSKAARGESVYREHCITCHALMDRTDSNRRANDVLVPIRGPFGLHGSVGTDSLAADNWNLRQARLGPLAGRSLTFPFGNEFPADENASVPSREILTHIVFRSIVRSYVPWREELTLDDAPQRAMLLATANANNTLLRYKARPLNGVWSTAPYLHNGSVLNMVELLTAPDQRKTTFRVGTAQYDPRTLGFEDDGSFEFNTEKPGNSNQGHAYGTSLSEEDKSSLLEFLKTL